MDYSILQNTIDFLSTQDSKDSDIARYKQKYKSLKSKYNELFSAFQELRATPPPEPV